jgi:hypothetical protein
MHIFLYAILIVTITVLITNIVWIYGPEKVLKDTIRNLEIDLEETSMLRNKYYAKAYRSTKGDNFISEMERLTDGGITAVEALRLLKSETNN